MVECVLSKCGDQYKACLADPPCDKTLKCAVNCQTATCLSQCAAGNYTQATIAIGQCVATKGCLGGTAPPTPGG